MNPIQPLTSGYTLSCHSHKQSLWTWVVQRYSSHTIQSSPSLSPRATVSPITTMSVDAARPQHIFSLQKRISPSERAGRRHRAANISRTESPASSIGTFFDDEGASVSPSLKQVLTPLLTISSQLPDASAYEASLSSVGSLTRTDSALSSRSDDRLKSDERSDQRRLNSITESTKPELTPARSGSTSSRTPPRLHLWPEALRISKPSPTEDSRPATAIGVRSDNAPGSTHPRLAQRSMSIDPSATNHESRPLHKRFNSIQEDDTTMTRSSSRSSRRPQTQHSASQSYDLSSTKSAGTPLGWGMAEATQPWLPGPNTTTSSTSTSPRDSRATSRRPSVSPANTTTTYIHKSGSSIDWTAVSPRNRTSPITRMPTPPESPTPSLCDDSSSSPNSTVEPAEPIISHHLTSFPLDPTDLGSPVCPTFLPDTTFTRPKLATQTSGFVPTHTPSASLDSINEGKEITPVGQRRSFFTRDQRSDSQSSLDMPSADMISPRVAFRSRNDSMSARSARSDRSDRAAAISESIRDLGVRWNNHFDRYAKLRQSRQLLHSEILAELQNTQTRIKGAKTPLQMQLEMASMDAAIDDCITKMSQVEKKRQRLLEELITVASQPAPQYNVRSPTTPLQSPMRHGHKRNESIGIQEMIPTPHSPPTASPMASLAAQVSSSRLPDRWHEKQLPRVPSTEARISSANSLSLANVMEFLDASEPEMV